MKFVEYMHLCTHPFYASLNLSLAWRNCASVTRHIVLTINHSTVKTINNWHGSSPLLLRLCRLAKTYYNDVEAGCSVRVTLRQRDCRYSHNPESARYILGCEGHFSRFLYPYLRATQASIEAVRKNKNHDKNIVLSNGFIVSNHENHILAAFIKTKKCLLFPVWAGLRLSDFLLKPG